MLKQRNWLLLFAVFFFGLAIEVITPGTFIREANAETQVVEETEETKKTGCSEILTTESIWKNVYKELKYDKAVSGEVIVARALAAVKAKEVELMMNSTDHIVSYHGNRFVITDDEYQVLLRIVESEAPAEDIKGKMLVANVVMNRLEIGFGGDTISEVVFAKGQFEPISTGYFFAVEISDSTIEAVERVLDGEDESNGALYFMARDKASKRGIRWFDNHLKFLFKHGGHEFFTEKE